jgi:2-polyprenyl-6-methoxyphenol hydroxylase-like FAD-dependent oxidoreductase
MAAAPVFFQDDDMTVLIAGAGIGGLTLALSCHQVGIAFQIFEQAEKIEPLGVGINLQPHAVRELFELGLEAELDALGVRTTNVTYFSKLGGEIWNEPRGKHAGYRWPQYSVHRGKLQTMLHDALVKRAGKDIVETGCALTAFDQSDTSVTIKLKSRSGKNINDVRGDILVGCDGIHSAVRHQLFPQEGPPVWGGAILWRGTTTARPFLDGATMAMAGHEFQKFVTYPVSTTDRQTGKALINWIAELKFTPDKVWNKEDWNRVGVLEDFLPAFKNWKFDWLDIPDLIANNNAVYEFPMVDRNPREQWTFNRVTLLGDAAHAMYPIGSNGATQGIVDARILVRELLAKGLGNAALASYEQQRRPITSKIVLANRSNGPDQILEIVEQKCAGKFDDIHQVISRKELQDQASNYKHLTGFDVTRLNAQASIIRQDQTVC